jgi:hypothetical protein
MINTITITIPLQAQAGIILMIGFLLIVMFIRAFRWVKDIIL